ncbi:hypothetical protein CK1_30820 [Ruminococcus sp. SR1/5]|nr:hypothetical protein CK1_30820 [Ruminococcus sp. SR1/5]
MQYRRNQPPAETGRRFLFIRKL